MKICKTMRALGLFGGLCLSVTACDPVQGGGEAPVSASSEASPDAQARARQALLGALPDWDQAINTVPAEVRADNFDPASRDALEMARLFSDEPLEFDEVRPNGRTVFKNAKRDTTLKWHHGIGYWKLISPVLPAEADSKGTLLSGDEALASTESFFAELGLPEREHGKAVVTALANASPDLETTAHLRHVRIGRTVNDLPVVGSHLSVTYDFDGRPAWVERRWPTFTLEEDLEVVDRETAAERLAVELAESFEGDTNGLEVHGALRYVYDDKLDVHHPVLAVSVVKPETDEAMHYAELSLTHREIGTSQRIPIADHPPEG